VSMSISSRGILSGTHNRKSTQRNFTIMWQSRSSVSSIPHSWNWGFAAAHYCMHAQLTTFRSHPIVHMVQRNTFNFRCDFAAIRGLVREFAEFDGEFCHARDVQETQLSQTTSLCDS
jgi:hypothetical protein